MQRGMVLKRKGRLWRTGREALLNARWNSLAGTDKERQSCDRRMKAPVLKDEFINKLQKVLERKMMAGIQSCVRLLQKSWSKETRSEKALRL